MNYDKVAERIVATILEDLTDRRGLRQAWDSIDDDVQGEIRKVWAKLVIKELERTAAL